MNPKRHLTAAKAPAKLWRYITEISVEANCTPIGRDYRPKFSSAAQPTPIGPESTVPTANVPAATREFYLGGPQTPDLIYAPKKSARVILRILVVSKTP